MNLSNEDNTELTNCSMYNAALVLLTYARWYVYNKALPRLISCFVPKIFMYISYSFYARFPQNYYGMYRSRNRTDVNLAQTWPQCVFVQLPNTQRKGDLHVETIIYIYILILGRCGTLGDISSGRPVWVYRQKVQTTRK